VVTDAQMVLQAPTFSPSNESKDQVVTTQQIPSEITPSPLVYSREFLLGFQQFCNDKIEGLIPEVLPGYVDPNKVEEDQTQATPSPRNYSTESPFQRNYRVRSRFSSPLNITPHNAKSIPAISKDEEVPAFIKEITQSTSATQETSPTSTPVMKRAKNEKATRTPAGDKSDADLAMTPNALKLEWKKKKEKPRESDPKRLRARQKQIDIGMNTVGYQRYLESTPVENRTLRIPDIHQVCSKRSWDGQVNIDFLFQMLINMFRFENGEENSTNLTLQDPKPTMLMM
jgi:hypothetical protein